MMRSIRGMAGIALAVLGLLVGQLRAESEVNTVRPGVYFFKNQHGVWLITFEKGGRGHADVRLIHDGEVSEDRYNFKWSLKGREVVRVRTTYPELKIEEHELLLPDGSLRPYGAYRDGKRISEPPKEIGTLEYLGREASSGS